jgi:ADP-heptose:LPS heptosyltransferase
LFAVQTSSLKRLDPVLHGVACYLAALLPRAGLALKDKTLIVRPGGMGDFICADIALQELGRDARDFTWLIEKRSQAWARHRGLRHLCYDVKPIAAATRVWGRYPLVINSEQRYGLAHAYALMTKAKRGRVVAFATNRGSKWSTRTVPYDWKDAHETIEFARLFAAALDLPEPAGPRLARPRVEPASAPPLVLIAGRGSPSRELSPDAWVNLISRWHKARSFFIGGAPDDADLIRQLTARFSGLATKFTGSFDELCAQISRSEEIFTMDGGAVHIASYYGVPTLALFTSGRDRKWHPLGEGSRVLRRRDLDCQPCTKFGQVPPCPNEFACRKLDDIVPEKIWN